MEDQQVDLQQVIQHLTNEIARLNVELAVLKALNSQQPQQVGNG
jgi:hypothetical protein